jgi:hypothetical protein
MKIDRGEKREKPFEELPVFFKAGCKGNGVRGYKPNLFESFL